MLRGEPIWTDELDRTDVDAELERRGGDQRAEVAGVQAGLDPVAPFLRQGPVMRGHDVVAEACAQLVREPLGHAARVDEDQRGPVLLDQRGDAIEDVAHLLGRRDRLQLALGGLPERQVEGALVAGVDDDRQRTVTHQQPADGLDRSLRGRQADALVGRSSHSASSRSRVIARRALLVARHRVDLVDDDRLDRAQRVPVRLTVTRR